MEGQGASAQIDAALLSYLRATHEADSERLLTELASEHVEPVIRRVVATSTSAFQALLRQSASS